MTCAAAAYCALLAVVWGLLRLAGDRWWAATMLLFGPRWVFALPLIVLVPAALAVARRSMWVLLAAGWMAFVPLMGLRVPWRPVVSGRRDGPAVRVLTCNIHRHATDPAALAAAVAAADPDVVAAQEWSSPFEPAVGGGGGGTRRYTRRDDELFVASRYPIVAVHNLAAEWGPARWGPAGAAADFVLQAPGGPVHLINLHLASPHQQFEAVLGREPGGPAAVAANSDVRRQQSALVAGYARGLGPRVLIAGDFNTPDDSPIFRESWAPFADAFSTAGFGFGGTYRAKRTVTRIDHVLYGPGWECRRCRVGPDVGSPHRPVIADLE